MSTTADPGSVTRRIPALVDGEPDAQTWFAELLLPHLCAMVRQQIPQGDSRAFDEEDVALQVLGLLLLRPDRFRQFENRADLEQIITVLVRRKAIDAFRRVRRRREHEVGESWFRSADLAEQPGNEGCSPQEAIAQMKDTLQTAIASIQCDPVQTSEILQLKIQGFSVPEIAAEIGRGERAVYRILERIRKRLLEIQAEE